MTMRYDLKLKGHMSCMTSKLISILDAEDKDDWVMTVRGEDV